MQFNFAAAGTPPIPMAKGLNRQEYVYCDPVELFVSREETFTLWNLPLLVLGLAQTLYK